MTNANTVTYRVVRKDNGPNNPHTGVVSNHKTLDAAEKAVEKANRSLRKQPGYANAWHPYEVQALVNGEWVRAERGQMTAPSPNNAPTTLSTLYERETGAGCSMCESIKTKYAGFGPRHDGSPNCESGSIASGGSNAHCACDVCF